MDAQEDEAVRGWGDVSQGTVKEDEESDEEIRTTRREEGEGGCCYCNCRDWWSWSSKIGGTSLSMEEIGFRRIFRHVRTSARLLHPWRSRYFI